MAFHLREPNEIDIPAQARLHVQTFNGTHRGGKTGGPSYENRVQRQGLGRLLLCALARRFMERGVTSMLLFGDAANPSKGFYEAFGAERLYGDTGEFHGGYGWRDLGALVARCITTSSARGTAG